MLSAANILVIARPSVGIFRQQASVALSDVEDDRTGLRQCEVAVLKGQNLTERMKCEMRAFLHRIERNKTHLVELAHFFKGPANACITRQSFSTIR